LQEIAVNDNFVREMAGVGGTIIFLAIVPFALWGLAIPYAILRIRDGSKPEQDPQLGLKAALYFSHSLGILLLLTGLTIYSVDLSVHQFGSRSMGQAKGVMDHLKEFNELHRTACALMLSGFVISFIHLTMILGFTNTFKWPEAGRVFVGWRFAIHSVVVMSVITTLMVILFQKNPNSDAMASLAGILIVWMPSWVIHLFLLKAYRGAGSKPAGRIRLPGDVLDRD
jgi:hypothetical protein